MKKITLLAYKNCSMLGITGAMEAFEMANKWNRYLKKPKESSKLFSCDIVTIDGKQIETGNIISIKPHSAIDEVKNSDFILIPAFLAPFNFKNKLPEKLKTWLKSCHEKGIPIGCTCTGTFMLAETGLLDGKKATTNWYFSRLFKKQYPKVNLIPERMIIEDNNIICTGATTSFLNLCVYLIEKFGSPELASYCSKSLLMDTAKTSQSPYFIFDFQKDHTDNAVLEAQYIMENNFASSLSVESLADELGISQRHFIRRFKQATGDSPLLYLQRVRIEVAKNKLETTNLAVDEITRFVGYEDTNSFRKLFKKHTELSPKEYRTRFKRKN